MTESIRQPDFSAERADNQTIFFEPGIHPRVKWEIERVQDKFYAGNLDAHNWNPQVAKRMRRYSPYVIAVDGDSPLVHPDLFTFSDKLDIWLGLPARPAEINPSRKEVIAILGDSAIYNRGLISANEKYQDDARNDLHEALQDHQRRDILYGDLILQGNALYKIAIGSLIYYGISKVAELTPISKRENHQEEISRRKFLQYGAASALALSCVAAFGTHLAPAFAGISTSKSSQEFWNTITTIVQPRFIKPLWANARTALLMAKVEDTMSMLDVSAPGSVVMGTAHAYEADILLRNHDERTNTIRKFAEYVLGIVDTVIDSRYPAVDKAPAHGAILEYLAKADLVKITDPGGPDLSSNPKELVDQSISYLKTFLSPQIVEVTRDLA